MEKNKVKINVMMFGGRRAGKTSVLAAMEACFEEQFGTSNLVIKPADTDTMFAIEEKQREIESYFGKNKRNFVADNEPTMEVHEYAFDISLKSRNGDSMTINFIDYPGEWLGKEANKTGELQGYMNKSNVIMIAIDTPYLMEETPTAEDTSIGQYNDYRNYCKRITNMIKEVILDDYPRMILFVPLKCEKYKNNGTMPLVATKIKEAYKPLFNYFEGMNATKAEMAIIPILTMGKAEFAKFERDEEGNILIDEKWKTPSKATFYFPDANVGKPEPLYCEQPMIFILYYLLEMVVREKRKVDDKNKKNPIYKWFLDNVWGKLWNLPSIEDFVAEKDSLKKKMKTHGDGFEIVKNPLKF